jgi:repressor LexA
VKRFRRTRTAIELIPENPDFQTIVVPISDADAGEVQFELEGLAVGLIRNNMMM